MKEKKLKLKTLIYHSLFWLGIYLLWIAVFRSYSVSLTRTMTIEFCYLIFITADYYAVSNFIIPQFLFKKRYILFIVFTVLIIVFSAYLRALVAVEMNLNYFHPTLIIDFGTLYFNSILNISLWVLLITIGKMLIDKMQTQKQLELSEKEGIKNELDYLKAQINPHALFNSLNTIYGHIDKNNQVARTILLQFSELLRYQLYDCGAEKVSLKKEIDYLENYIAFQRLRKENRLIVVFEIENKETDLKIAPLLLVVLIENAFKFVSNFSEKENKIVIKVHTENTILFSSFYNTTELQQTAVSGSSKGIGIVNLKRRLELLYPKKHELTTESGSGFYQTYLKIDLL